MRIITEKFVLKKLDNQNTSKKLLNYFGQKDFSKHNKTNQGFDGLLKKEQVCKPSLRQALHSTSQYPNFSQ